MGWGRPGAAAAAAAVAGQAGGGFLNNTLYTHINTCVLVSHMAIMH